MPAPSSRQLLRRHVVPFTVTLGSLTTLLLANSAARLLPQLRERGASPGTLPELLLLAMPSVVALTIPMAVFIAVAWVFTRLGREGVLTAVRGEPHGLRRLIGPVLAAATLFAGLTFVSNAEILPRANARYTAMLAERPVMPTDRSMTIGELREASRRIIVDGGADAAARAAAYEVEVQKKFALAAASLVLALAGAAIALRFPRGGPGLVIGASGMLFAGYYVSLVAGEALADLRLLPPVAAMWLANVLILGFALLLVWLPGGTGGRRAERLVIDG